MDASDSPQTRTRPDRRIMLRLLRLARPHVPRMAVAGVCLLVSTLGFLAVPYTIRLLTDSVFVHHDPSALNRIALLLALIVAVSAVFDYGRNFLLAYVGLRIVTDLRIRLYQHLLDLSIAYYDERRTGDLMSRLSSDTGLMQQVLSDGLLTFLQQIVTLVGIVVVIFLLNWRLALVTLVMAPVVSVSAIVLGRRMRRLSKEAQAQLGQAGVVVEETLSAMRVVKAFGREPYELGRYRGAVERSFAIGLSAARLRSSFGVIMMASAFTALGTILWVGGHEVLAGRLTPGGLIAFLFYITFLIGPLEGLGGLYGQLQQAAGGAERVYEVLDAVPAVVDAPGARPLELTRGEVELDNVTFAYAPGLPDVLRDVSLVARPGRRVAIVGPSGAGKTTLVSLLPRYYDPTAGRIRIDGQEISRVTLESLRARLAVVPQEATLFGGTVRENIAYGRLEATQAEIEAAALAANAHAFITALPQGYETIVGERGIRLSGGQRQRVAIARAVLKNPRLLILDEATSALDNESEALVQEALERLMLGRTTFVIAHRLTTVENADWIVVLDEGTVVEQGTHASLLAAEGLYSRLYLRAFDDTEQIPA